MAINTLTQTTLAAAINDSQNNIVVASTTGITVTNNTTATLIYVDRELMTVLAVNSTTGELTVARGSNGTPASGHASGAMVLAGAPDYFIDHDPQGASSVALVAPLINTMTGKQWLLSSVTGTWVPGFQNQQEAAKVTAPVASAAGAVLPSGPLFHITGTAAITGFTIPVGCDATAVGGSSFTVIPDAIFTWTAAGNIALAGTAVVNKALTFIWDAKNSKWIPSYIS